VKREVNSGKTHAIQAVIFDLDGTLIDSMGLWVIIDQEFLSRRGITMPDDYVQTVKTMSFADSSRYTIERFALSDTADMVIQEWMDMAVFAYANKVPLKPGVLSYLQFLQKNRIKIGLATTNTVLLYEPVLRNNGVYDYFSSFTTIKEVSKDKGHPDIYLLAARKLGADSRSCMVFEDTLLGVTGAKKAQMKVIGVFDAHSAADKEQIMEQADIYIYAFEQMMTCHEKGSIILQE